MRVSKSMDIMQSKNVSNVQVGDERFQQIMNKDWERYQGHYAIKKIKKEQDAEKKEKRNVLHQKYEENLIKLDKETK